MFALAIFPPFLAPGAEAIQMGLKRDPGSLGLVVHVGIALGAGTMLLGGAIGDVDGCSSGSPACSRHACSGRCSKGTRGC